MSYTRKITFIAQAIYTVDGDGNKHYGLVRYVHPDGRIMIAWEATPDVIDDTLYDEATTHIYQDCRPTECVKEDFKIMIWLGDLFSQPQN